MVLFSVSLNGFFLRKLLLHTESNESAPINLLSIVSALGCRTQAADGFVHPTGRDAAAARTGKAGGFMGTLRKKSTPPEALCATEQRLHPWASRQTTC
jgi:hypothetical protein